MGDSIKQKNVFGGNTAKSSKTTTVKVIVTWQRVQGFIAGVLTSILAIYIYDWIK